MSDTNIFKNSDAMPMAADGVVHTHLSPAESMPYSIRLPGQRKFPNDVVNTREKPQATGRRP